MVVLAIPVHLETLNYTGQYQNLCLGPEFSPNFMLYIPIVVATAQLHIAVSSHLSCRDGIDIDLFYVHVVQSAFHRSDLQRSVYVDFSLTFTLYKSNTIL